MTDIFESLLNKENWSRHTGGPLYMQLQQQIEMAIQTGLLKAGSPLPSERKIAQISDISRVTVRKAVQELVEDGYVIQKRGSGTFVAPAAPQQNQQSGSPMSFTEEMRNRNIQASCTWLERGLFSANDEEFELLDLKPRDQVARIARIRFIAGKPVAIDRCALPSAFVPNPLDITESLYEYLARDGNRPVKARQRITACLLNAEEAEILGAKEGEPALLLERFGYTQSGKIVEHSRTLFKGDSYTYRIDFSPINSAQAFLGSHSSTKS